METNVMRYSCSLILLMIVFACNQKEAIVITPQNVREILTQYGKDNPENQVIIETAHGTIKLRLYEDTPLHRANFIKLIKEGYYEDANFYRIVYEFMIQGGDLNKKLDYRIPAEFNPEHFHKKGALSMARVDENNPNLESSSTEFFIIQGERYADWDINQEAANHGLTLTPAQKQTYLTQGGYMSLDGRYTVFGEVTEGLGVIDKIAGEKVYNVDKPLKKIPLKITLLSE